ncbi:MAG: hypothetical protein OXF47_07540 [Nitrospira sp.]|nr:hypothetical protein [Nitrospira sp.]
MTEKQYNAAQQSPGTNAIVCRKYQTPPPLLNKLIALANASHDCGRLVRHGTLTGVIHEACQERQGT